MNIVVCAKQIPDPASPGELDVQIRVGAPAEDMTIERADYRTMTDEEFAAAQRR